MSGPESYPFDPSAEVARLSGLEKLRAIKDRSTAALLFELHGQAERNEKDPRFQAHERAKQLKTDADELEWLEACVGTARSGGFGKAAEEVCNTAGFGNDRGRLQYIARELRKLSMQGRLVRR